MFSNACRAWKRKVKKKKSTEISKSVTDARQLKDSVILPESDNATHGIHTKTIVGHGLSIFEYVSGKFFDRGHKGF